MEASAGRCGARIIPTDDPVMLLGYHSMATVTIQDRNARVSTFAGHSPMAAGGGFGCNHAVFAKESVASNVLW